TEAPSRFELDELFEPFITSHADEKHLGLGLPLVASLAGRHGGTVELTEEKSNGGYIFSTTVRLPRSAEAFEQADAEATAPAAPAAKTSATAASALQPRLNILVV